MNRGQTFATRESTSPNLRHRWWYGDAREVGATTKSAVPNLRNTIGDYQIPYLFSIYV